MEWFCIAGLCFSLALLSHLMEWDRSHHKNDYVSRFRCSGLWFRLYSKFVSEKSNSPEPIAATTSAGGVTTVNTTILLAQPSVQQAIQTLSAKAAGTQTNQPS